MLRASQVNQARVHNGYHYPRSLTTALSSVKYYERFTRDHADCNQHALRPGLRDRPRPSPSSAPTVSSGSAGVPASRCERLDPAPWFAPGTVDAAYLTEEYSFDAGRLREAFCRAPTRRRCRRALVRAGADRRRRPGRRRLHRAAARTGAEVRTAGVLNASYAGTNQVLRPARRGAAVR